MSIADRLLRESLKKEDNSSVLLDYQETMNKFGGWNFEIRNNLSSDYLAHDSGGDKYAGITLTYGQPTVSIWSKSGGILYSRTLSDSSVSLNCLEIDKLLDQYGVPKS